MYLVVFRNRKRADLDAAAYAADADAMHRQASAQPGFIAFKSYCADDGEVVAISEWTNEAAALAWRRASDHAAMQDKGRRDYYDSYTMFGGTPHRVHRFSRSGG